MLLNLSCFRKLYKEGTQVTLTAASNTILTFTNWTGDNGETAGEIKINMNTNHSVTANYSAIDYIVGWDFYKSGSSGRPADFASTAENESTTLILIDADGNTQSWLDKNNVAAGGNKALPVLLLTGSSWDSITSRPRLTPRISPISR